MVQFISLVAQIILSDTLTQPYYKYQLWPVTVLCFLTRLWSIRSGARILAHTRHLFILQNARTGPGLPSLLFKGYGGKASGALGWPI